MHPARRIAWVLAFLLMGCAGIQTGEKMSLFDDTRRAYLHALRWGDYEAASAFKKQQGRDNQEPDFEDLQQIRVTAHSIKQTIVSEDQLTIVSIVDFQYYRITNVTVENLIDQQKWAYDEEANRWFLMSGLPDFK
jgi:hypothetical protein